MPESVPLYTDMTVREYLDFFARLRGVARDRARKRINEVGYALRPGRIR